jgi:hypothetical protein
LPSPQKADAIRLVLAEIPGNFIPKLCTSFDTAVAEFRGLVNSAPHTVTAHTAPDDAAAHVQLLAATDELTIGAADRLALARVTGESQSLGHDSEWLWLSPDPEAATVFGVSELLTAFTGHTPLDLDGWARAVQTGICLATYNEAEARRDRFLAARSAAGMQDHGGMRDTPLSVAYALAGSRRPPAALAQSM